MEINNNYKRGKYIVIPIKQIGEDYYLKVYNIETGYFRYYWDEKLLKREATLKDWVELHDSVQKLNEEEYS